MDRRGEAQWINDLMCRLRATLQQDRTLAAFYRDVFDTARGVHLGVFVQPYLAYLLDGKKTVESRFSVNRCPPYRRVRPGDILLLKSAAGPIVGICRIEHVWFYTLDAATLQDIQARFTEELCAQDPAFWSQRARAAYATLMRVGDVRHIDSITITKRDRRGWVTLHGEAQLLLIDEPLAPRDQASAQATARELASRAPRTSPISSSLAPEDAIVLLRENAWRAAWWSARLDPRSRAMLAKTSCTQLMNALRKRLRAAIGRVYEINGVRKPYRDGYQTPLSGNILFYAQHATATCCRRCVEDWYAIPNGRELATDELEWLAQIAYQYLVARKCECDREHE